MVNTYMQKDELTQCMLV